MIFTIDRSQWVNATHGIGLTQLYNTHGFCCCLGFVEQQLGISQSKLRGKLEPRYTDVLNILTCPDSIGIHRLSNSHLARQAMAINDMQNTTDLDREIELCSLFFRHGHEIIFTGEYAEKRIVPAKEK